MKLGLKGDPSPITPDSQAMADGTGSDAPKPWRAVYLEAANFISPSIWLGLVCWALIGGVGGRLSMFILRVTSDDDLRGMKTDDDFTIGQFSGDTVFLVLVTAVLGAAGGLVYLGVREWLPRSWRAVLFGLLAATVGGALVVRPDGIDFTLLDPLWLAVGLFVVLPAAYGASLSVFAERLMASARLRQGRWTWLGILPLGLLAVTGPVGVALLLLLGLVVAANRSGRVTLLWRSGPVTWLGRGVFVTAVGLGAVLLVRDVVDVL